MSQARYDTSVAGDRAAIAAGMAAAGIATQAALANTVSVTGASHDAQMFISSAQTGKTSLHPLNNANSDPLIAQALNVIYNGAVSGQRFDQYISALPAALATASAIHWFGEGDVNDFAYGVTADQLWNGWTAGNGPAGASSTSIGVLAAMQQVLATGRKMVLPLGWGQSGMTATTYGYMLLTNQRKREFARGNPNILLLDERPAIMWDASTSQPGFRTDYTYDSPATHASSLGGYYLGKALAQKLSQWGVAPKGRRLGSRAESGTTLQKLVNPAFTGTGGTNSGSGTFSGTKPDSWDINTPSGWSVTSAVQAETGVILGGAAGNLNELVLTVTASGAGSVRVQQYFSPSGLTGNTDNWRAGVEWAVDAGHSNFYGVMVEDLMQNTLSQNVIGQDGYTQKTPIDYKALPAVAITRVLETPSHSFSAVGGTGQQWYFNVYLMFGAAGAATVRLRAPTMAKQLA